MSKENYTVRKTPPETAEEYQYIWEGVQRAHDGWPVMRVLLAIFLNWKVILLGVVAGLVLGGQEVLQAWGVWK